MHNISVNTVEKAAVSAISSQVSHVLDLSETLDYIQSLPVSERKALTYENRIEKLEKEIERCRRMKLRIYEDMTGGVITKEEYADFRAQYTILSDEKAAALERIRREYRDMTASGESERVWAIR